MARTDNEYRITPSVLDRLLDFEPELSSEAPTSAGKSLRLLKQSVRRDLEWLLNARQFADELPAEMTELSTSVLAYGLPDFSTASRENIYDQNRMRLALGHIIQLFEPRLIDVEVSIEPARDTERALRFRIDAHLRVEPVPEPVTFDTVLQLHSGEYKVEGG